MKPANASKQAASPAVKSKLLHTSLLDNLTTSVILLDDQLCIFHINPAAEALLETSDRRSHKVYIGDLILNADSLLPALQNVRSNGNTFIARKGELRLATRNSLVVDYAISPLDDFAPGFLLLEIQSPDKAWEIHRKEALLSTHEATSELVRGLGHEIKNPLGGIRGAAQLLALELDSRELQDYTNIIIEETDRLVNLVDRLTGSYRKPVVTLLNIHEVTERVRGLLEAECRGSINIGRDYDPSIPEFMGDSEQLIQAVLNIARNAMQALNESPETISQPRITLRTRTASHIAIGTKIHKLCVRVQVIDNGPGIPAEMLGNIFYPLISGRAEGTGLGLSIAQSIVKSHKGLIECESRPGHTVFTVTLPINKEGNLA